MVANYAAHIVPRFTTDLPKIDSSMYSKIKESPEVHVRQPLYLVTGVFLNCPAGLIYLKVCQRRVGSIYSVKYMKGGDDSTQSSRIQLIQEHKRLTVMPFFFTDKRFLVSGASRDMGRVLALSLAKAGGEVYALGRNREEIESLVNECENIQAVITDLSNWEKAREELKKLPSLHGVVNMADHPADGAKALEVEKEALMSTFDVALMAPINVIQVTATKMIEDGIHGSIVNVSSIAAIRTTKGFASHAIAKAGLDMVTKQFALELGPHQIRVNSVNPTGVWTGPTKKLMKQAPDLETKFASNTPLGRFCEIQEVVEPIMYLLSEHSAMVTGTTHLVDGGVCSNIPV